MISFSVNVFSNPDHDDGYVGDDAWAELDAMVDPGDRGCFVGGVSDLLAALEHHPPDVPPSAPAADAGSAECRWCGPGDCGCPRTPAPGTVPAWLASLATRPVDEETRAAVALVDPAELPATAVRDYLVVTDKVLAADTGAHHRGVLAVADTARAEVEALLTELPATTRATRWRPPDTERMVREDVERTLRISSADAQGRVELATDLRDRLPVSQGLLSAGMLSARKAAQLSGLLGATSDAVARTVDAELGLRAQGLRPASLRRRVTRRVAKLDPDHLAAQEAAVVASRRVRRWSEDDGSATLALTGPPDLVQRAWLAVTGTALAQLRDCSGGCHPGCPHALVAREIRGEGAGVRPQADTADTAEPDRTYAVRPGADSVRAREDRGEVRLRAAGWLDRARFDATVDLLTSAMDAPWFLGGPGRRRTLVQLVTTAETLSGASSDLSMLAGHGPVSAATARRIAADADLYQDVVVHPTMGFLLDAGTVRHDPPERLREFLLTRRPTCSLPGCTQPARSADLDHGIEHVVGGDGGPTAAWSMGPLCRFHHRARTLRLWRISDQRSDGSMLWRDPSGRTWQQPAYDLRPDSPED